MTTRNIIISLLEQTPQKRVIKFTPRVTSVDADVLTQRSYLFATDENGDVTAALPCKDTGSIYWQVEIPKDVGVWIGHFYLQAGGDITLADALNAGTVATSSVEEYIDAKIAALPGQDPDIVAIAAIDSTGDGVLATDGGGWFLKTYAALKTALGLVKSDVGLGSVDNTADINKPVSTAQAAADATVLATAEAYADAGLAGKVPITRTVNGHALSADVTVSKSDVGLSNVDNTSDANKPVSTLQAAADTAAIATAEAYAIQRANHTGTQAESTITNLVTDLAAKEATANKDATGGYVGMTLFKINFKNAANTFTSFLTNTNTAARTYTFQDRNGTIADDTDLAGKQATLVSGTNIKTVNSTSLLGSGDIAIAGMAIGNSITSATQGSVLFVGASGVLAQNNAAFFWDDSNGELRIKSSNIPNGTYGQLTLYSTNANYGGCIRFGYNTSTVTYRIGQDYNGQALYFGYSAVGAMLNLGGNLGVTPKVAIQAYYADTGGVAITVSPYSTTTVGQKIALAASATADAFQVFTSGGSKNFFINKNCVPAVAVNSAPADGDVSANQLFWWFDSTNGASKAMFKGKSADGTVVTGSVTLA